MEAYIPSLHYWSDIEVERTIYVNLRSIILLTLKISHHSAVPVKLDYCFSSYSIRRFCLKLGFLLRSRSSFFITCTGTQWFVIARVTLQYNCTISSFNSEFEQAIAALRLDGRRFTSELAPVIWILSCFYVASHFLILLSQWFFGSVRIWNYRVSQAVFILITDL